MKDDEEFKVCRGSMKVCQFSDDDLWNCWEIVACVMHLGNIQFGETEKSNMPVSYVDNRQTSSVAAQFLKVQ